MEKRLWDLRIDDRQSLSRRNLTNRHVSSDNLFRYGLIFQVQSDGQLECIEGPEPVPESVLKHETLGMAVVQVGYGEDLEALGYQVRPEVPSQCVRFRGGENPGSDLDCEHRMHFR